MALRKKLDSFVKQEDEGSDPIHPPPYPRIVLVSLCSVGWDRRVRHDPFFHPRIILAAVCAACAVCCAPIEWRIDLDAPLAHDADENPNALCLGLGDLECSSLWNDFATMAP